MVVNGRTEARVAEAVEKIRAVAKGSVSGIAADAGTRAGADVLVSRSGEIDVLVNSLGIFEPKAFGEISDDEWVRFFEINVLGGVRLSRACLPGMVKRNWGRVVFISSESGIQIPAEMIHYGVTKSAQISRLAGLRRLRRGLVSR